MSTNWRSTLWDIILTILTLGISHIQKRKKKLEEEEGKKSTKRPSENWSFTFIVCISGWLEPLIFVSCFTNVSQICIIKNPTIWFLDDWILFLWSHLGLNQGLPDYESGALTNWAMGPAFFMHQKTANLLTGANIGINFCFIQKM